MAEPTQTEPKDPAGTGGAQEPPAAPAATQEPPKDPGAATGDGEKTVTLSEKDYKNLVAARDRANDKNSATDDWVAEQAMRQGVEGWLGEHSKDYPDVKMEDLLWVPEEHLEEVAKQQQRRIDDAVQAKLEAVQNTEPPRETPEEMTAREATLKKKVDKGSFGLMVRGRMAQRQ